MLLGAVEPGTAPRHVPNGKHGAGADLRSEPMIEYPRQPMTDQELEAQRTLVLERIQQITDSLPYLNEETQAIEPSVSLGRLTRMEALNDKGVNEHVLDQAKKSLERLQNALRRIDEDSYGRCVRCGREIPLTRLQHVPEALLCVPCAEKKGR